MKINVIGDTEFSETEKQAYADYLRKKHPSLDIVAMTIQGDDDFVKLYFSYDVKPFERIRRITGYLVGDLSRWNDAKQAELEDRVKHG